MVLDAILPVVSRSSNLALRLYQVAAVPQQEAKQLIETAKVTNSFALNLKQVGTLITENDRLPSPEVCYDLKRFLSRRTIIQGWDLGSRYCLIMFLPYCRAEIQRHLLF
jgi:hypothetical protein